MLHLGPAPVRQRITAACHKCYFYPTSKPSYQLVPFLIDAQPRSTPFDLLIRFTYGTEPSNITWDDTSGQPASILGSRLATTSLQLKSSGVIKLIVLSLTDRTYRTWSKPPSHNQGLTLGYFHHTRKHSPDGNPHLAIIAFSDSL